MAAGRKPLLTADRKKHIVMMLSNGVHTGVALRAVGVNPETFYRWLRIGKRLEEKDLPGKDEYEALCRELFVEVSRAAARYEVRLIMTLNEYALEKKSPREALVMLERRFPKRWQPRQVTTHEGSKAAPVEFTLATPRPPQVSAEIADAAFEPVSDTPQLESGNADIAPVFNQGFTPSVADDDT